MAGFIIRRRGDGMGGGAARPSALWAARLESWLLRLAIISLLLLVVIRGAAYNDEIGLYFGYGHWLEGVDPALRGDDPAAAAYLSPAGAEVLTVSIMLVNRPAAPEARLAINGVTAATFADPHVTIQVRAGDELWLHGGSPGDGPLVFRVVDAAPGLGWPREGTQVVLPEAGAVPLGRVER